MLAALSPAWAAGIAADWPAQPSHYVVDRAEMIDAAIERTLNGVLQELEQKTKVQFLIATTPSLDGSTKEEYALALAEKWRLGQKREDTGLLFLLAQAERQYRFETGYGLEGTLPDSYLGQVGRETLAPLLRQGKSSAAIAATAAEIIGTIAKEKGVELTGMPSLSATARKSRNNGDGYGGLFTILAFIAIAFFMGRGGRSRRSVAMWRGAAIGTILGSGLGGGFRGGFGGRSGGFGGFGGGGGGGFGGGGAGGSW